MLQFKVFGDFNIFENLSLDILKTTNDLYFEILDDCNSKTKFLVLVHSEFIGLHRATSLDAKWYIQSSPIFVGRRRSTLDFYACYA